MPTMIRRGMDAAKRQRAMRRELTAWRTAKRKYHDQVEVGICRRLSGGSKRASAEEADRIWEEYVQMRDKLWAEPVRENFRPFEDCMQFKKLRNAVIFSGPGGQSAAENMVAQYTMVESHRLRYERLMRAPKAHRL